MIIDNQINWPTSLKSDKKKTNLFTVFNPLNFDKNLNIEKQIFFSKLIKWRHMWSAHQPPYVGLLLRMHKDIQENINIKSVRAPINNECETKP